MAVLRVPKKDRLRLTDRLLKTLPAPNVGEPDEILGEVGRRDAELESGKKRPLTAAQFKAGVRRRRASDWAIIPRVRLISTKRSTAYDAAGGHVADRLETEFWLVIAAIKSEPRSFPLYF